MPLTVPHCVDGRCTHHAQTSKDLEESSDVKPAAFGESEELAEEQEQSQDAEDDRQDHGGLDRLQPFAHWWGVAVLDGSQGGCGTVLPEISRVSIAHEPLADDGGDEEQH